MAFFAPLLPALGTALGGALGGAAGGGGAAPAAPAGPVKISFGSKTLGTGAKGGDTTATGGDGANVNGTGGAAGSLPDWVAPAAVAIGGVIALVLLVSVLFKPRKRKRDK